MIKQDLVKEVARQSNITQALALEVVNLVRDLIVRAVRVEGVFEMQKFGTFKRVRRQSRMVKAFGTPMKVPAKEVVKFKASRAFLGQ